MTTFGLWPVSIVPVSAPKGEPGVVSRNWPLTFHSEPLLQLTGRGPVGLSVLDRLEVVLVCLVREHTNTHTRAHTHLLEDRGRGCEPSVVWPPGHGAGAHTHRKQPGSGHQGTRFDANSNQTSAACPRVLSALSPAHQLDCRAGSRSPR